MEIYCPGSISSNVPDIYSVGGEAHDHGNSEIYYDFNDSCMIYIPPGNPMSYQIIFDLL